MVIRRTFLKARLWPAALVVSVCLNCASYDDHVELGTTTEFGAADFGAADFGAAEPGGWDSDAARSEPSAESVTSDVVSAASDTPETGHGTFNVAPFGSAAPAPGSHAPASNASCPGVASPKPTRSPRGDLTAGALTTSPPASSSPPPVVSPAPSEPSQWGLTLPERSATGDIDGTAVTDAPLAPFSGCAAIEWLEPGMDVRDMTADGNTLVGNRRAALTPDGIDAGAFRWPRKRPVEWLDARFVVASASADAATAAGVHVTPEGEHRPAIWRQGEGVAELGIAGAVTAVSANGDFAVGSASREEQGELRVGPFRWSARAGVEWLPLLESDTSGSLAWNPRDVSADGAIIVGWIGPLTSNAGASVITWNRDAGTQLVGSGDVSSLSHDGVTAVGGATSAELGSRGYVWKLNGVERTAFTLSTIEATDQAPGKASLVNRRGDVVFGVTAEPRTSQDGRSWREAYVATPAQGTRLLADVLAEACVDVGSIPWDMTWEVTAISDDDNVLAICGDMADASRRCWLAQWE